jgi:UDP-N-acetylmuramoylalanine--D-glutamate ligase
MGGRFKGGDFRLLSEPLKQRNAIVVAIGEAAPLINEAFDGVIPVHSAIGLPVAVRRAAELAPPGGTVLLAPACSSFDMFRDYAERGQVFKREVMKLVEESKKTGEQ